MKHKGNTHHYLTYHVVFSTKRRRKMLTPILWRQFRGYIKDKEEQMDFECLIAGGSDDHVHLLLRLRPTQHLSKVLNHIKGYSSRMMPAVYWQKGYSVFSIHKNLVKVTFTYIRHQRRHHKSFDIAQETESIKDLKIAS